MEKLKTHKLFKNKAQMIIYIILGIIILMLFVLIGRYNFNKSIDTDKEQFNQIFTNVSTENVFVFGNATEVNNIINSRGQSGIILFGFKANEWTKYYAEYINDVAKELKIDKVIYYDFESDRIERNGTYETIVNSLSAYTEFDDYNTADIYAPTLVVIKNGQIIGFIDETSMRSGNVTPQIYWNPFQIETFKSTIRTIFEEYIK